MEQTKEGADQAALQSLLQKATAAPPAGKTLEKVDPMERIPSIGVGKEWTAGMTVSGYFAGTEEIPSLKSRKLNEEGKPAFLRHILRVGSPSGERLGLWSTASLEAFFEKVEIGTFVTIKYLNKGVNEQGNANHFFEFKAEPKRLNS